MNSSCFAVVHICVSTCFPNLALSKQNIEVNSQKSLQKLLRLVVSDDQVVFLDISVEDQFNGAD